MIPLLQVQTVPLTPLSAETDRQVRPEPTFLPLVRKGGAQTAMIVYGARSFPVTVRKGRLTVAGKAVTMRVQNTQAPDGKGLAVYQGEIVLSAPGAPRYYATFIVTDSQVPDVAKFRDQLALTPMFGYLGSARLGGKKLRFAIRGGDPKGASLLIDRDGDGRFGSIPPEVYRLGQPFRLGGTTYRATSFQPGEKPRVTFAVSPEKVAEIPMPPDLRVGRVAPPLAGKTLAGKPVAFPKSWPGKLVLLDVWATWCGPCVGEIPYMKAAYAKYKARGFEIVSISIDDPNMRSQVAAFTKAKGSSWVQVYEGQGWGGPTPKRYGITGIPFMLLVDGSTGRIVATESSLRGPSLDPTLAGLLAKRKR